jgi:hypothetical protein
VPASTRASWRHPPNDHGQHHQPSTPSVGSGAPADLAVFSYLARSAVNGAGSVRVIAILGRHIAMAIRYSAEGRTTSACISVVATTLPQDS